MGLIDHALHRQFEDVLASGDMFALFEQTREAIEQFPDDPDVRYLQVLAMARLGDPHAALRLYKRNCVAQIGTEDAIALKGRLLKDLAVLSSDAQQIELFRKSSRSYREAHELSGGYFSALNAATTSFLAGDATEACELAATLGRRPEILHPEDYFAAASRAEAMLICGEVEKATALYAAARLRRDAAPGHIASTARQVRLIASKLTLSEVQQSALLASIRPAPVVHYCGHMLAAGWHHEEELVTSIRSVLEESGALVAYGSLACGADILVAEAVLARRGELHVVLPFDEEDFLKTSVNVGGAQWSERYRKAREGASSISFATQMRYVGDDEQFAYGSRLRMGLARLRARIMHADVFQLAVWDGIASHGNAGTGFDCKEWARQGGKTRVVSVNAGRPTLLPPPVIGRQARCRRVVRSIIFADFFGFSRLDEDCVPQFLDAVMGRIASILDRHSESVLSRNSWGDAIFVVVTSPEEAAGISLEIQSELDPASLRAAGLPEEGGMRMSLHFGPIFEHFDAIQGARTFYGNEINLAARIEPRVPVGAIYTTQPFAAMFDHNRTEFHFEYVGKMNLAKDYGARTLYRLSEPEKRTTERA
jgi:hypothetical protein